MQPLPKISIVTPSFNQAQFIESTIESVLSQKYPNLEYIIIDGGSTDGSIEIIKKYERYLHFWCSGHDAGQYDAINKGFRQSTGEIMAWLNSDDMYFPWALKTVADIMTTLPNIQWLTTLSPGYWDYNGFCTGLGRIPGYSLEAFLDGCYLPLNNNKIGWIQQESTFWRREIWEQVGGQLRTYIKLAGDFDLWSRFYTKAVLYGTPSPLGGFRHQYHQKSQNIVEYVTEAELSLLEIRHSLQWKPNSFRGILMKSRIQRIPKLGKLIESKLRYNAKKVIRKNVNQPDAYWQIEDYSF